MLTDSALGVPMDDGPGLRVLCVDDEPNCLDEIQYLVQSNPRVAKVLTASSAAPVLDLIRSSRGTAGIQDAECPVDVIFLDISMPGLSGMELARMFSSFRIPPALVFVTGYAQFAFDAFKLGAFDYIEKPPDASRVDRALRLAQLERRGASEPTAEPNTEEMIPVELGGVTRMVPRSSVRYVEAQGDYVRMHTGHGESHLVRRPLSGLEEDWADAGYLRIHRQYLVALTLITELRQTSDGYRVLIGGGTDSVELPVSRRHARELKDQLLRRGAG